MADKDKNKKQGKVNPIQVQKFLKGINYPCSKDDIVKTAKNNGADDNVMNTLNKIADREYEGPTGVTQEIGKVNNA